MDWFNGSGRVSWQSARVVNVVHETAHTTSLVMSAPMWRGHRAGQHVEVRRAPKSRGSRARRSYCLASAPEDQHLMLTVESNRDGDLSRYLCGEVRVDDELELRGPLGRDFSWDSSQAHPLQLIAGGYGVVPLRAMLRHRVARGGRVRAQLLYSARSVTDLIYAAEIPGWRQTGADVAVTLTRRVPQGWTGLRGRVGPEMIETVVIDADMSPVIYVCGSAGFVDTLEPLLLAVGHAPARIHTQRFGPTD
jgi:ferredoxin-NADP reductase